MNNANSATETINGAIASRASDEVCIEIIDMNKWYGHFHVLKDLNLTVTRGSESLSAVRPDREIHHDPLH